MKGAKAADFVQKYLNDNTNNPLNSNLSKNELQNMMRDDEEADEFFENYLSGNYTRNECKSGGDESSDFDSEVEDVRRLRAKLGAHDGQQEEEDDFEGYFSKFTFLKLVFS